MTGTDRSSYQTRASRDAPSGWTGWVVFAGVLMIMMGAYQAILGFVALFDDGYYAVRPDGLVVNVDYTTWGWVHLLLGLLAFFAGFGVISRADLGPRGRDHHRRARRDRELRIHRRVPDLGDDPDHPGRPHHLRGRGPRRGAAAPGVAGSPGRSGGVSRLEAGWGSDRWPRLWSHTRASTTGGRGASRRGPGRPRPPMRAGHRPPRARTRWGCSRSRTSPARPTWCRSGTGG